MVAKDIILKHLDEVIKSHQHLTLNKQVKSTFNDFASETRNRKKEKAILTNDKGDILTTKNGNTHSVDIGSTILLTFWDKNHKKPVHIDHNHPNTKKSFFPTQLSDNDINRLLDTCQQVGDYYGEYMVKSVTAEDSFNHSRMTLVRGDKFNKETDYDTFKKAQFYMHNQGLFKHVTEFNKKFKKNFQKLWDNIEEKPPVDSKEYEQLQKEISITASDSALKETGYYKDLKRLEQEFRKANCKLTFEWVDE